MERNDTKQLKLRVPEKMHEQLELLSWWERRTLNAQVVLMLERQLKSHAATDMLAEARAAQEKRP